MLKSVHGALGAQSSDQPQSYPRSALAPTTDPCCCAPSAAAIQQANQACPQHFHAVYDRVKGVLCLASRPATVQLGARQFGYDATHRVRGSLLADGVVLWVWPLVTQAQAVVTARPTRHAPRAARRASCTASI